MRWLLKLSFDQNLTVVNHKPNGDFKSHIIFKWTHEGLTYNITLGTKVTL